MVFHKRHGKNSIYIQNIFTNAVTVLDIVETKTVICLYVICQKSVSIIRTEAERGIHAVICTSSQLISLEKAIIRHIKKARQSPPVVSSAYSGCRKDIIQTFIRQYILTVGQKHTTVRHGRICVLHFSI